MSAWHPEWPGFGPRGSLLLPLPAADFRGLEPRLRVDALELRRKTEFHVTLLGRALAARLHEPAAGGTMAARLPALFAARDWRWRRTGTRWLLMESRPEADAHSVIELLDMPALNAFRREVGTLLREPVPPTPAHVTLYLQGTTDGIGLHSQADFERLRLHAL